MAGIEYINYDESVDHLTIFKEKEKIDSSIDKGLVILSLNKKKEVVGIEFMGIHKNFNIPFNILRDLTGCNVNVFYDPNKKTIIVNVFLKHPKVEVPLTFSSNLDLGKEPYRQNFACSVSA